jgi:hypothetical protein
MNLENKPGKNENKDDRSEVMEFLFEVTKVAFERMSKSVDPEEIASMGRTLNMIEFGANNLIKKTKNKKEIEKWQNILNEIQTIKNKIKSN